MAAPAPRLLRCPKCSATVSVAPGAKPACSACGFGAVSSFGNAPVASAPGAAQAYRPQANQGHAQTYAQPNAQSAAQAYPQYNQQYAQNYAQGYANPYAAKSASSIKWLTILLSILVPISALLSFGAMFLESSTMVIDRTATSFHAYSSPNGLGELSALVTVVCIVFGLIWVGKMVGIVRARTGVPMSPAWAVCSWIIPVGHMVTPYFPMGKAWNAVRAGGVMLFAGWAVTYGGSFLASYVGSGWTVIGSLQAASALRIGQVSTYQVPDGARALGFVAAGLGLFAAGLFVLVMWAFHNAAGGREQRTA